jgi:hypothetical protein
MVLELQVQPCRVCFSQGVGGVHLEIVKCNRMVLELQVQPCRLCRVCFIQGGGGGGVMNQEIFFCKKMVLGLLGQKTKCIVPVYPNCFFSSLISIICRICTWRTRYLRLVVSILKPTSLGRTVGGAFLAQANMIALPPLHRLWCRQS